MILLDMRGELPYRDGYTSRPFRTNSDDVLFGVPIITIFLSYISIGEQKIYIFIDNHA